MNAAVFIPLLPLLEFLLFGLAGRQRFRSLAGMIGTLLMFIAAVLSLQVAYHYFFLYGQWQGAYPSLLVWQHRWLEFTPALRVDMGLWLDSLSVMMLVMVSVISFLVHLYSMAYMKGEERYSVFFAYLGLFTFSMLGLVLSSNLIQIYVFWELVGVSSFLLIGFYYDRPAAVKASRKAFIVTRFADLGFLIGILILAFEAQTFDFRLLIERLTDPSSEFLTDATAVSFLGASMLTWGLVLVFMGGAGKSAMFPLHIWLPDAMEGPTPVSALIHAATMVVAGVFLVARLFPVFALSCPVALDVVMIVGILSALLAALMACTQTDVKRILAYSTMSQIGLMMFALGVARWGSESLQGFTAGLFHLFTHAFFKALLFLAAGVIIHHVHSNEIKNMGGLRSLLPFTHVTFLIACLTIAGIPPLSGFFSKEAILLAAWHHHKAMYLLALLLSGLTAFYMFRLYFCIFWHTEPPFAKPHQESHGAILMALLLLSLGAAFSGFIPFSRFVTADGIPYDTSLHLTFSLLPLSVALTGMAMAMRMYKTKNPLPERLASQIKNLYLLSVNKFYIDELYTVINRAILKGIALPAAWIDRQVVDGAVNLTEETAQATAEGMRQWQSGKVQMYAFWFLTGLLILAMVIIFHQWE
jgi:NADH-quinone oxidoreductase subunit L